MNRGIQGIQVSHQGRTGYQRGGSDRENMSRLLLFKGSCTHTTLASCAHSPLPLPLLLPQGPGKEEECKAKLVRCANARTGRGTHPSSFPSAPAATRWPR